MSWPQALEVANRVFWLLRSVRSTSTTGFTRNKRGAAAGLCRCYWEPQRPFAGRLQGTTIGIKREPLTWRRSAP